MATICFNYFCWDILWFFHTKIENILKKDCYQDKRKHEEKPFIFLYHKIVSHLKKTQRHCFLYTEHLTKSSTMSGPNHRPPHQPSHPHVTEVSLFRCTHHQWWTITLYDETNIWIKDNAIYAYCATKYEEQKWYTKFGLPSILVYIHIHLYIKNHGKFW